MSEKIIFTCTWGAEEPERATLPFVAANVAALAGQQAVVLCTVEAVRLGVEGGAKDVAAQGFPPLAELYRDYVAAGGQVWLCGACTKPRGISDVGLAAGTTIVGAAMVVEEIVAGARTVAFA
jgi:predicted peroxiredoxin